MKGAIFIWRFGGEGRDTCGLPKPEIKVRSKCIAHWLRVVLWIIFGHLGTLLSEIFYHFTELRCDKFWLNIKATEPCKSWLVGGRRRESLSHRTIHQSGLLVAVAAFRCKFPGGERERRGAREGNVECNGGRGQEGQNITCPIALCIGRVQPVPG